MQAKTFEVLTVSLDQCLIEGPSRVGIKAWRLAQLDSYGYKVPPALIIPADEVVRIWKDGQLIISDEIVSDLWHYSCKRLEAGSLIVRSSGQEDGEKLSFAGQFKSITDVNSVEEFKEALRSCIASSESGSIQNYSKVMNGKNYSEGYSVMIMPQRDCVFSGILFSEVHVNGNESDLIVLQVTHGNNFGLTSGSESGDILYIDKLDGSIICSIPQKRKVAGFDSVTVERLYNMALALETKFGFSVDLEWGVMLDGTIELFQVRPITTLNSPDSSNVRLRSIIQTDSLMKASLLSLKDRHISLDVNYWSDQNIAELITDQPSRMAFGIFTYIFAHGDGAIKIGRNQMGYDIGDELTDGFFELIGGRPRCSIIHDALTYRVKGIPLDDYVSGFISRYLDKIKNNVQYANYPEVVLYEQNPAQDSLIEMFGSEKGEQYAKYYQNFFDRVNQLEKTVVEEFKLSFEPSFIKYIEGKRDDIAGLDSSDLGELVNYAQSILDHLRTVSCVMFVKIARLGFFAYARLRELLNGEFGENKGRHLLDQMTAGLEDDSSMLFNVRLAQLRDEIVDIESVLLEFGHLGPNELEIANPRYHNQVDILKKLSQRIQGNPANELHNRAVEADKVTNEVASSLDESLAAKLRKDVKIARRYLALRERAKYYFLMEYDCLRQALEKISSELKLEHRLIFELDPRELSLLVSDIPLALLLMRKRYQERDILANIHIPPVITLNNLGDIGQDSYDPTEKIMMGIGITPIVTTGEAIVVLDPNDTEGLSRLKPGMVLVAKTTDPTWAPIIAAVGGNGALVTEIGGPLAHGAIVARDLGIACVQNVPMVTKRIQNGNIVKVDGKNGIVTVLS